MKITRYILIFCTLILPYTYAAASDNENPMVVAQQSMERWPNYVELLKPYIERAEWIPQQHKKDRQLRSELDRFLSYAEAMGYFATLYQSTEYPDFWPIYNQAFPLAFNNPDDAYYGAVVDDDGVYKISGYRNSVHILDVEVGASEMQAYGRGPWSPTLSHYRINSQALDIKQDGSFEVILSSKRPEGYKGDWWQLKKGGRLLLVRQMSYDWLNEVDARLAIERLDVPAIKPRSKLDQIDEKLSHQSEWVRNWLRAMVDWHRSLIKQELVNDIQIFDFKKDNPTGVTGGIHKQQYMQGLFQLEPDEALILESEVPDPCKYWMFHLTDQFMGSVDFMNRQSSINGFQAKIDSDGKFRAVIAATDPGVPNWLDTAGYKSGGIVGRRLECHEASEPVITKVKLFELRSVLPEDTPVVTAEQRDASIRLRRKGTQLRRRW
jgi:hypothetical protein